MEHDLAAVVERVPGWAGRAWSAELIQGGWSHTIHRLRFEDDPQPVVLRVLEPALASALLGIAAELEIANSQRAARSGVAPRVLHVLPDVPAVVLEHVDGVTLTDAMIRDPDTTVRVAHAVRALHDRCAPFPNAFDVFAHRRGFLALCAERGLALPDGYLDHGDSVDAIEAALTRRPLPTRPCHNDLLAANLMDDGAIRIIDFQLSGQADPSFELGNIAAESDFGPDDTARLVDGYFGAEATPALHARVRLMQIASNVTWSLWFTVHAGVFGSGGSSDYWTEAMDKWTRATDALADPELGRLLDSAGRPRGVSRAAPTPAPHGS